MKNRNIQRDRYEIAYSNCQRDARLWLDNIRMKLDKHSKQQEEFGEISWGFVGDIEEVCKKLQAINDFIA